MPRPNVTELNEARRRSGNLGGRPPKPTVAEARAKRLEELVPKAMIRLEANLETENESVAQRAVDSVLDRAWGKPIQAIRAETVERPFWSDWTPEQIAHVRGELERRVLALPSETAGNGSEAG